MTSVLTASERVLLVGCLASMFVVAGCPQTPPDSPVRYAARGAVLALADGIRIADHVCAEVAKGLEAKGDHAAAVSTATHCATGYQTARHGLLAASAAVDAWSEAATGRLACGAAEAVAGLSEIRDAIVSLTTVPAEVDDALQAGQWAARYAEGGAGCPR